MRILITGSRTWTDAGLIRRALGLMVTGDGPGDMQVIHGGCPTGADALADAVVRAWDGMPTPEVHPALWDQEGRSAGRRRNQRMVDAGADVCLAFRAYGESHGTEDCAARARIAGITVRWHYPWMVRP